MTREDIDQSPGVKETPAIVQSEVKVEKPAVVAIKSTWKNQFQNLQNQRCIRLLLKSEDQRKSTTARKNLMRSLYAYRRPMI